MNNHIIDKETQSTWLVTGAAGFIGSHIAEYLLKQGQKVVTFDVQAEDCANINDIKASLTPDQINNLTYIEGDIRDKSLCQKACEGVDYVLHQAAIGSVPRSFDDLSFVNDVNVSGFLNIIEAAHLSGVKNFVYASSSAIYGDSGDGENIETQSLLAQSPYAVGKYTNELYADVLSKKYGIKTVGLRYFNVYGPRQDANGAYAAVIPRWLEAMQNKSTIEIYGDGEAIRDFCFVKDVVRANILAALCNKGASHEVYNVASGEKSTLNALFCMLKEKTNYAQEAVCLDPRHGDIKISFANVDKAKKELGFSPKYDLKSGLHEMI